MNHPTDPTSPITEADLHAHVDGQLPLERQALLEAYLATHPHEAQRVEDYRAQNRQLHALFDPVLSEPVPRRLVEATRPATPWYAQRLAASIAIALVSGAMGWGLRGTATDHASPSLQAASYQDFAQRAAIAHAVYSPDVRRAVEVSAEQEGQLTTWLSKRMGAPMKAPHLQGIGYTLDGGRLLPGGTGPVAQFMYHDGTGAKLTLYVSNEVRDTQGAGAAQNKETAFRFAREGSVNVFYWIDGPFGYALSAGADKAELARVSAEVYRQVSTGGSLKSTASGASAM